MAVLTILTLRFLIPFSTRPVDHALGGNFEVIDGERNDTEAHHDARVWTACRQQMEVAFGLADPCRIPHLLNHRWLCRPGSTGRDGSIGKTLRRKFAALATARIARVAGVKTWFMVGIRCSILADEPFSADGGVAIGDFLVPSSR